MLNLPTITSALLLVTGSAVTTIEVHVSFVDLGLVSTIVTPGAENSLITTATTTTIAPSPGANTDRNVKFLSVQNTSAAPCQVTIQQTDGTNVVDLFNINLLPGYTMQYNSDGNGFVVYNNLGYILVAR